MEKNKAKHCRKCQVKLVSPDNWYSSRVKAYDYICNDCTKHYYIENRERLLELGRAYSKEYYWNIKKEKNMKYKIEKLNDTNLHDMGRQLDTIINAKAVEQEVESQVREWDDYDYAQAAYRQPIERKFYYIHGFGWAVIFGDHIYKATPSQVKEHFRDE